MAHRVAIDDDRDSAAVRRLGKRFDHVVFARDRFPTVRRGFVAPQALLFRLPVAKRIDTSTVVAEACIRPQDMTPASRRHRGPGPGRRVHAP